MSFSHVLVELVVVLGTAAVVTVGFQALRLPVVLGYVVAGLLIGPHVPVPLVANPGLVHVLSELGVILLMFTVGTELRLSTIARVGVPAAMTALFEVALVVLVGTLVARALGFAATEALFAGACLGISSTMLVAKAFEERGWTGGFTELVFAILVFEDLIAIVLLAVLTGVASGAGLDGAELVRTLARLGGFLAALLIGGLLIVPRVMRHVVAKARRETVLVFALAICFGAAALADRAGYSVALGAFLAGVLVAESGHGHDVFALVQPFRDVFAMVFFVSVGMTIAPDQLYAELPTIAVFAAVVLVVKPLGVALGGFFGGHGVRPAVRAGLSLAQIGELSFVIAGLGASSGVARPSLLAIAVGVACVTTLTSELSIGRSEAIAGRVARWLPGRITRFESFYGAWLGRLRERPAAARPGLRRPIVVLILDAAILVAIVIAASTAAPRGAATLGLAELPARLVIVALALALATPFAVGVIRRIGVIARRLAIEVIPAPVDPAAAEAGGLDLGRAPRRSLTMMFALGLSLAIGVPIVAVTQPFVPGGPVVIVAGALALGLGAWRVLRDFDGHVRAGSELILELLRQAPDAPDAPAPLAAVEAMLPGFGGLATIAIAPDASAVGRSLAELDLRARTGATVLAIARGPGAGLATPAPSEPLHAGDVLAMAGTPDAIAAARALLA